MISTVKKILYLSAFQLFFCIHISAQTDTPPTIPPDTLQMKDTTRIRDTTQFREVVHTNPDTNLIQQPYIIQISKRPLYQEWKLDPAIRFDRQILSHHPYLGFNAVPVNIHSEKKVFRGKELLFYSILLLILFYALLRNAFPKYFNDLFRLFFRTTMKQRQIREQLMQTPFPSVLLNSFFVISAGLYLSFLIDHYQLNPLGNFWLLFLYCVIGLTGLYLMKYLGLKVIGWVFNRKEAANSYLFVVFIINKMAGLLLLPFLVLLAFTSGNLYMVALTLSYIALAGLLAYRFILTYTVVRNQVRVNPFQFFLYLCAFEIAPLLLVYKLLLIYFRIST
jgi:hypothetical protein